MFEVIIAIIISSTIQLLILLFAIKHFNKSYETNQEQFEITLTQKNNIETIKQIHYFEEQFLQIASDFNKCNKLINKCVDYANLWTLILDRMCFLYDKKKIDRDFLEYFKLRIDMGKRFVNWLQLINREEDIAHAFQYFLKHYSEFEYTLEVDIEKPFIFFLYKYKDMPTYDTEGDTENSLGWKIPEDYKKSEYYELLHRDPLKLIKAVHEEFETIFKIS